MNFNANIKRIRIDILQFLNFLWKNIELYVEPMLVLFGLCDKNCFVHYNNYNFYYKYFFLHLQDDLLINLVIEQMINDTDPGTSSLQ